MAKPKKLTSKKARTILREGTAKGKALTTKQKGFFGLIAGGGKPTRLKRSGNPGNPGVSFKGKRVY